MKMIVAVDKNWAIGYEGKLLVSIPNDQKNFRRITMGNTVILGRKTMETFPGGRPLQGRRNIILSRNPDYEVRDAEVVHSIEELLALVSADDTDSLYVIGGESLYRSLLPYCNEAVVTKIAYAYQADAYFPNLDEDEEWECVEESEEMTCFDIEYTFCRYIRKSDN